MLTVILVTFGVGVVGGVALLALTWNETSDTSN